MRRSAGYGRDRGTGRWSGGRGRGGGRRRDRAARLGDTAIAAVTVVALGSGVWLLDGGTRPDAPPQPAAAEGRPDPAGERAGAPALPPSPPLRIRIPAIRVDAPLTGLALTRSGSLDAPPAKEKNLAGWYEAGTTPGETGTAIVAGHVDNTEGPAVFYDLGALKRGARIEVDRRDGTVAVFTVDAVEVYSAHDFPDDKVYGAAPRPELRVITCGGGYSRTTGYQGNVVVFARLTGSR
ncbi:class F sortase [Streptomyces capoamus]|uniref:Class F sortase n=1 Tax=Streptomyces capoamus TaxID=68183 RepID=A0A919EYX5_9ACTN|nr:class F sortase [Streptomyces capoamus]GGW18426.1 class F sortase [Streptomyces libani subsp. rufus]GHG59976.1 class F sortase [Streptomyces capoamus]